MRFARWGLPALVVVAMAGAIDGTSALARSHQPALARRASQIDARVVGTRELARSHHPARARRVSQIDARVVGRFAMLARVTAAVNVRGEHRGEHLARTWTIVAVGCQVSVCQLLRLDRERSRGQHAQLTLRRAGRGRYLGRGVFYAALSCRGRVYPQGSRVPYVITLTIGGATIVEGIRFAQRITATYLNPTRSDATRCPLGPSHDAASYTGRLSSAVPSPPTTSFSTVFGGATDTASFTDTSVSRNGGAPIVSRLWNFGDGPSGSADSSTLATPVHQFSAPGTYSVALTVTDANGLSSSGAHVITAPGPPTASFTATQLGLSATFADHSTPGIGGAAIVGWSWDFGDPGSGTQDTSTAQDPPSHTFSAPGSYPVTLTVTDASGFQSITRQVLTAG